MSIQRIWTTVQVFTGSACRCKVFVAVVFFGAYWGSARLGSALSFPPDQVASLWPANSIAVAALLFMPACRWWACFLIVGVVNVGTDISAGLSWRASLGFLFSNYVQLFTIALVFRRYLHGVPRFGALRDLITYFGIAVVLGPALSAFPGAAASRLDGGPANYWTVWRFWFLADALTHTTLTPAFIVWLSGGIKSLRAVPMRKRIEGTVLAGGIIAVGFRAFVWEAGTSGSVPVAVVALLPFLVWLAVRFGTRGTSTGIAAVSCLSVWSAANGYGPFHLPSPAEGILAIQVFLVVGSVPLMFLAALIEERKRVEDELRDREERYRLLFNSGSDAVFVHEGPTDSNLPGKFIEVNETACRRLGYTREELLSKSVFEIDAPDTVASIPAIMQTLLTEKNALWEGAHTAKDGRRISVEINAHLLTLGGKQTILSTVRDITERREFEAQLRQSQKMDAIGTLAGGIAHDFNNILAAVMGYAELLKLELPANEPSRAHVLEIVRASQRGKELVQQILTFSRRQEHTRSPVCLQAVVAEALKLMRASIPANVEIVADFKKTIPPVLANTTQIHQVILNLGTNAWHAIGERPGKLEIRLEQAGVDPGLGRIHPHLRDGRCVQLSVSDNGHGMDPAILDKIFDPFFTTKEPGKGTGLGLAVVHGIVKEHNGAITVVSRPGQGTTFNVYFPGLAEDSTQPSGAPPQDLLPGQGQRILFVDDEHVLATLAEKLLSRLGYRCTTRTDPLDARALLLEDTSAFDLVLTDMTMPVMNGTELAREMSRLRPGLPVILVTGRGATLTPAEMSESGISGLLEKPFDSSSLAKAVQLALLQK